MKLKPFKFTEVPGTVAFRKRRLCKKLITLPGWGKMGKEGKRKKGKEKFEIKRI